jgi:hypothetical protein
LNLKTTYLGGSDPFEGDIELLLQGLLEGAQVTRATVMLAPAKSEDGRLFEEIIAVPTPDNPGDWGATKINGPDSCEVDFHSRRTISEVLGSGGTATLQVDLGGVYIGVAEDGTFLGPEKNACQVNLSNDNAWQKLPSLTIAKLKLYQKGGTPNIDIKAVKIRSTPSNVSVRLAGMPPLWTIPGELATARASFDFAPVLNAFLAGAKAEHGVYSLPFIIHSDTIARLDVTVSIDYCIRMPVFPYYLSEIKLHYGYSGLPDIDGDLMTVNLPRGAKPVDGTLAVLNGIFEAGRVAFGDLVYAGDTYWVGISQDRSLAQPFFLDSEAKGTGIDLPLKAENGPASLHLAVQEDDDGKPSGKVLAGTDIELEEQSSEEPTWLCVKLPAAFRFLKKRRYWLVLQSLSGIASWQAKAVDSPNESLQSSIDGGFSWRRVQVSSSKKPQAALFRVREMPLKFKMPVVLQIGEEPNRERAEFDKFAPLGKVEFEAGFAGEMESYLDRRGFSSSCSARELLKNGSFEEPYCGDSDRIILGIDCTTEDGFLPANGSNMARIFRATRFVELSIFPDAALKLSREDEIISSINQAMGKSLLIRERNRIKLRSEEGIEGNVCLYRRCRQDEPASWQVSGHVLQLLDRDNNSIVVLMEPLSFLDVSDPAFSKGDLSYDTGKESSMISQIIDVKEGCTYALSFFYWTEGCILHSRETSQTSAPAPHCIENPLICGDLGYFYSKHPSWEIKWLGAGDLVIDHATGTISPSINKDFAVGDLQEYQRILVAPRRSTKARVRFKQPGPGVLMLREVSFVHDCELLIKGDLDPTISKTFEFNGSDRFILECKSRQRSIASEIFQEPNDCARLELKWLPESIGVGEPKSVNLGARDFSDHFWIVAAPSGAKHVEIRLVQLVGTTEVEYISLRRMETVSVPLTFLAEAPGEITVSGMQIIYDLT